MRMYDLIKKKRDGQVLSDEEIQFFIDGYVKGEIPDYQASALLMAIYFQGMNSDEISALTFAVRDSGDVLHFDNIEGVRVDKHSTGGVGDKTSLVVTPIVASLGVKVAKMSGRGLGHTGGTIDKLESIEGMRVDMSTEEFTKIVNDVGICIVGQSADLAPADKKLYALRDVTATVDSIPLIVSSIMGKKLAADDDCIVLDVKTGSGSFMKTVSQSVALAQVMVDIGKRAGKKMRALITDMDIPLGNAIGNSLEVKEAIDTLFGQGPRDFTDICIALASHMLELAGKGSYEVCEAMVRSSIESGEALNTLAKMVEAQGGNPEWIFNPSLFPNATTTYEVKSPKSGFISHMDTEGFGIASLMLGAGRNTKEEKLDYTAGIKLRKKTGDYVKEGEVLAKIYTTQKPDKIAESEQKILNSITFSNIQPEKRPLILEVVN